MTSPDRRRLGNWVLSGLVNLAFGTRYTDLCYGYNAFWSDHLPALNLDCSGFEIETVMNIRAAKADLRVQEIPSHELAACPRGEQPPCLPRRLADPEGNHRRSPVDGAGRRPDRQVDRGMRSPRALVGLRTPPRATHQWIGSRALVVGRPR